MIKIKWIEKKRQFVPGLGEIEQDQQILVNEQLARGLIRQGKAVEVLPEKTKKVKEED